MNSKAGRTVRINTKKINTIFKIFFLIPIFILAIFFKNPVSVYANQSPAGCTGSGLGINLFSSANHVHIGDTITFSLLVFNGTGSGPVVCDATGITASIVTPDGVNHPITLSRTTLTNGQSDTYSNVVTYVAHSSDVKPDNTLKATASDTGIIHQNEVNSEGGSNQGLNIFILNDFHVIKNVINDNGGTKVAADFSVHVKTGDADIAGSPSAGAGAPGTLYSIILGTYGVTVSEDPSVTYTQSFSGDCDANGNITLALGDNKTCIITNNDIPPKLHVIKNVINDNGGTSVASDFILHVTDGESDVAGSPASGSATPGRLYTLRVGNYNVSENLNSSYTQSFSGDCDENGNVSLALAANKTCIVTNNDISTVTPTPTAAPTNSPSSDNSSSSSNSNSSNNSSGSSSGGSSGCTSNGITSIPKIILAKRQSPTSIFVQWGPYQGYNDFLVEYGFENGKWLFNTKVSGFSTVINNLPPDQSIWIHLAATDNCTIGSYGTPVRVGGTPQTNTPGFPNTGVPGFPNTFIPKLPNTGYEPKQIYDFWQLFINFILKIVHQH